jgi:lipid-binding SYLF domain-containing protein
LTPKKLVFWRIRFMERIDNITNEHTQGRRSAMNLKSINKTANYTRFFVVAGCIVILGGLLFAGPSFGKTAKEIDVSADAAMDRFYKLVKDGKEVVAKSKGILVLPNVKKGALIIGAEYGQGAMRIGGKTVEYYSMGSGSVGLQIGGQSKDIIIAFMSGEALKKFRTSKGWEAGVDGGITLIQHGESGGAITAMANQPIVAFVLDGKGLMVDVSLKGAKFNKLDMSK